MKRISLPTMVLLLSASSAAGAHVASTEVTGVTAGVLHPFSGMDHLLTVLLVGIWAGGMTSVSHRCFVPSLFLFFMTMGSGLGFLGYGMPLLETAIAFSVLLLGLVVTSSARPGIRLVAVLMAGLAALHGNAHGLECPVGTPTVGYLVGLLLGTALLLGAGMMLARRFRARKWVLQLVGLVGGVAGAFMLVGG